MALIPRSNDTQELSIETMNIADGLKQLLVNHGFTRHQVLIYTVGELSEILEVDEYVAKQIRNAAK